MDDVVFPRMCFDGKGHNVQLAEATKTGGDDRTLYCSRCGDAVPLRIAIARTPSQVTGLVWPVTDTSGTSTVSGKHD